MGSYRWESLGSLETYANVSKFALLSETWSLHSRTAKSIATLAQDFNLSMRHIKIFQVCICTTMLSIEGPWKGDVRVVIGKITLTIECIANWLSSGYVLTDIPYLHGQAHFNLHVYIYIYISWTSTQQYTICSYMLKPHCKTRAFVYIC